MTNPAKKYRRETDEERARRERISQDTMDAILGDENRLREKELEQDLFPEPSDQRGVEQALTQQCMDRLFGSSPSPF